jgi:hypothetical protein
LPIAVQACAWAGVGSANEATNHSLTGAEKPPSGARREGTAVVT